MSRLTRAIAVEAFSLREVIDNGSLDSQKGAVFPASRIHSLHGLFV